MRLRSLLWLVLSLAIAPPQGAHKQSDEIGEEELSGYLAKEHDCQPEQIHFAHIDEVDFLGVGYNQAVVVAYTCMTGTAGPDVHGVYTRYADGEIKELKMQEVKFAHQVLFGNANSEYRIGDGVLVEVYRDTSEREDPVVVKYKWNAKKEMFEIVSQELPKRFSTSYDCDKAEKDGDTTALAICYVKSLAALDVELAQRYKAYLAVLSETERRKEIEEQRQWLKERNENCVIYKWWVDCLDQAYQKRIAEVDAKLVGVKKP